VATNAAQVLPGMNESSNQSIENVGRFVADVYLSYGALETLFERGALPPRDQADLAYRHLRSLWNRVVDIGVTARTERTAAHARLYAPILSALGFELASLRPTEIDISPERVPTSAIRNAEGELALLIEELAFGQQPDDRYDSGPFRGSAQRKMERMLAEVQVTFGLIVGGPHWRLVQLDTAGEPRYLEFDLDAIFASDDLDGFRLFFALVRPQGLLGGEKALVARLVEHSDEHGTSVGDALGPATRRALQVFLEAVRTDESNVEWAPATFADSVGLRAIHEEGIYTLFRLLFVLYGEAMGLLPIERPLYREAYSIEYLRGRLTHPEDFAENSYALWERLQALFLLIDRGVEARDLRIPTYNGGLFGPGKTPRLMLARVSDRAIAEMLRGLTTVEVKIGKAKSRDRVSFRELGVAQLGAVFESLLDYEPEIAGDDLFEVTVGSGTQKMVSFLPMAALGVVNEKPQQPAFRRGAFYLRAWGGQRKATGSYYTPQVIAEYLVREALGPQIVGKSSAELLELTVCDPAMGSGGFLVAATKFLGDAYYEAQIEEALLDRDDLRAADHRTAAWRTVAEHCIYGVDMNPLAVELAKVSLWLTTLAYDRPLSFFDHHLRCGNSLLGAPLRTDDGAITGERIAIIPKEALADVDKEATPSEKALLKRARDRNNGELRMLQRRQTGLFAFDVRDPIHAYARARAELSLEDATQSVHDAAARNRWKERQLQNLTSDPRSQFYRLKQTCDLWMASWFWVHDTTVEPPSTEDLGQAARELWETGMAQSQRTADLLRISDGIADVRRFFHWELEFPEVFERGGFSAFVGNPPWEAIALNTKEFFSNFDPLFRTYSKQRAKAVMAQLRRDSPVVNHSWRAFARHQRQSAHFLRTSGAYTWYVTDISGGDAFNLFRSFLERDFRSLRVGGILSQVLPDTFYLGSKCAAIRRALTSGGSITRLIVNENRKMLFPIESTIKIALLTAKQGGREDHIPMAFFVGKDFEKHERGMSLRELTPVLAEPEKYTIPISIEFVERLTPQTYSFLEIVDRKDAELLDHLSRHAVPLGEAWTPDYCAELHASLDSDIFRYADWLEAHGCLRDGWNWVHPVLGEFWPLVEGRNIYQFEFPVGAFDKWINATEGQKRLSKTPEGKPINSYPRLAWRNVARSSNERSLIASIVPAKTFCKDVVPTIRGGVFDVNILANIAALLNSFALDVQARIRGSNHLSYTLLEQLFVPSTFVDLKVVRGERAEQESAVFAAFQTPFELAEHVFVQFPLLDRLMSPLPGEAASTVSRDAVLACYAELLRHPRASYYHERTTAALALGAVPFVPATREAVDQDDGASSVDGAKEEQEA
jgi:hypothetical protein